MARKGKKKAQTGGETTQPRPVQLPVTGTLSHTSRYPLRNRDTTNTTSQGPLESSSSTIFLPAIVTGSVDLVIDVAKVPQPPTVSLNIDSAQSQRRRGTIQTAAGQYSPAVDFSSAVAPISIPSNPSQGRYNAVPPPDSLTRNYQIGTAPKMATNSPVNYSSTSYSTFTKFQAHVNEASPTEQAAKLPSFMGNLQIDTSSLDLFTSPSQLCTDPIKYSAEYMLQLRSFLHSKAVLQENGYILQQLSENELERKKKCTWCGKSLSKGKTDTKEKTFSQENGTGDRAAARPDSAYCEISGDGEEESYSTENGGVSLLLQPIPGPSATPKLAFARKPILRCKFHNGIVRSKMWSCCGNHVSSDPCTGNEFHIPRHYPEGNLEKIWTFYATPVASTSHDIRAAVAIDCEMGTAKSGDNELIRVSLIDYFSSAVLVDKLVFPDVEMEHYNTRFSGVTRQEMDTARRNGTCFMGRDKARKAIWRFVGPNTVVVGHSANNDLNALRWIHPIIVDTFLFEFIKAKDEKAKAAKEKEEAELQIVESSEVTVKPSEVPKPQQKRAKGTGPLALKTLVRVRLGRDIQTSGKKGHDSLEDAIAARDLAHWNIVNKNSETARK